MIRSEYGFGVLFCAAAGGVFAVLCSLWVGLIVLVRGIGPFDHAGLSPLACVGVYFIIGPLGGALIGVMLPLARSMIGYMFVGFVGVLPLYGSFAVLLVPREHWVLGLLLTCWGGVTVGALTGYFDWRRHGFRSRSRLFSPWPTRGPWRSGSDASRSGLSRIFSGSWNRIVADCTICVAAGVALGVMFCLIALLIFLFRSFQPFDSNHVSIVRTLATYLVAGALGGLVVGLTLPLTRWMPGAALVAFLAAFVVWFAVGCSISPQEPLLATAHASAVLGAAFGLPIGVGFWFQNRLDKRSGKWF